jgi:ABC-type amino acid transport system permease subunit
MAAQTRRRSGAVRLPPEGDEEGSETPEKEAARIRVHWFDYSTSDFRERHSAKRLWGWIVTTLLLALVGFLLGLVLGGAIST